MRSAMHRLAWARVLALGALLVGCASRDKDGPVSGLSADQADELNAQRSQFETGDDPPMSAATHHAAGRLAESQGAFSTAVAHYEAALKLEHRHLPSLYRLGVVLTQARRYADAIEAWRRYGDAAGDDPAGRNNLAFCYDMAGLNQLAEMTWQRAIERHPADAACRVNYGLYLARQGRTQAAMELWKGVLTAAQMHYNLGAIHEMQGRKEQAQAEYRESLRLDPRLAGPREALSRVQ